MRADGKVPPEPIGLRDELRALALDSPHEARAAVETRVATYLGEAMPTELVDLGIGQEALAAAVASLRREIWLWVVGERRWAPTAESVIGRAARRSSAA